MSAKTKKIIAVAVLLVLVAAAIVATVCLKPGGAAGDKTITVQVIHGDGTQKDFTISTDAEFLRGALEQEGLVQGDESEYGLFVTAVDGETADSEQQQWWCFTKGGEDLFTGVDSTPIADGDKFEITLKTGY